MNKIILIITVSLIQLLALYMYINYSSYSRTKGTDINIPSKVYNFVNIKSVEQAIKNKTHTNIKKNTKNKTQTNTKKMIFMAGSI